MCDTVISQYTVDKLPGPPDRFNYIQGVFLLGMERCYAVCKKEEYLDYIRSWVDYMIEEDGTIKLQQELLDDFMPAVLLIRLYRETGCKKYKTALDSTIDRIRRYPKNRYGGFFHKEITPDQMWLDGLFMAGILLTSYAAAYDAPEFFDEMHHQAMLMRDHIRDPETHLYYHAWDAENTQEWANPATGTSSIFWGRAMGWVSVALCEMLDCFPESHPGRADLLDMLKDLLENAAKYQDSEKGLWYQVVNEPDREGNWCETSCSSLFAYSYHKAVRKGYIDKEYSKVADKAFEGIKNIIRFTDEGIVIPEISVGTNVMCTYEEYIARPRIENDNHGTGTFVLMCSEFAL
ncbi:MAG: glycoside hydrolase family 88 protein [Clostridia bacterium]|nr:glycoside hydrolase family 88 protein [Clostridia bacterium]